MSQLKKTLRTWRKNQLVFIVAVRGVCISTVLSILYESHFLEAKFEPNFPWKY